MLKAYLHSKLMFSKPYILKADLYSKMEFSKPYIWFTEYMVYRTLLYYAADLSVVDYKNKTRNTPLKPNPQVKKPGPR